MLYAIDVYYRYTWVFPLKDKKGITITNASHQILDDSNCKSNKIWVDKGNKFYNRSVKLWLQDNDIEINSTHSTIKMKAVNVKSSRYIDIENNDKNPKFKVGDHVNISKYKNISAKGYITNWSEEVFVIKKLKNTIFVDIYK